MYSIKCNCVVPEFLHTPPNRNWKYCGGGGYCTIFTWPMSIKLVMEFNPEGSTALATIPSADEAYTSSFSGTAHKIVVLKQLLFVV